eukprot:164668_1
MSIQTHNVCVNHDNVLKKEFQELMTQTFLASLELEVIAIENDATIDREELEQMVIAPLANDELFEFCSQNVDEFERKFMICCRMRCRDRINVTMTGAAKAKSLQIVSQSHFSRLSVIHFGLLRPMVSVLAEAAKHRDSPYLNGFISIVGNESLQFIDPISNKTRAGRAPQSQTIASAEFDTCINKVTPRKEQTMLETTDVKRETNRTNHVRNSKPCFGSDCCVADVTTDKFENTGNELAATMAFEDEFPSDHENHKNESLNDTSELLATMAIEDDDDDALPATMAIEDDPLPATMAIDDDDTELAATMAIEDALLDYDNEFAIDHKLDFEMEKQLQRRVIENIITGLATIQTDYGEGMGMGITAEIEEWQLSLQLLQY